MAVTSGKDGVKKIITTANTGVDAVLADIDTLLGSANGAAKLEAESARNIVARVQHELKGWLASARSSFGAVDSGA